MKLILKEHLQRILHLTHEQAVFVALALEFASNSLEFQLDFGTYGAKHLKDAIIEIEADAQK